MPKVLETVLMIEQLDKGPFTVHQVKYYTGRDPCLLQVLTYVQKGWPNHVNDVQLKPYWQCRTELSTHMVVYYGVIVLLYHYSVT